MSVSIIHQTYQLDEAFNRLVHSANRFLDVDDSARFVAEEASTRAASFTAVARQDA